MVEIVRESTPPAEARQSMTRALERIDVYPTHTYQGYKVRPGKPMPHGASLVPGGVSFSIFSRHADYCVLVLYRKGERDPFVEIPFRGMFQRADTGEPAWGEFRIGNVFSMTVFDLDYESIEYGFRMNGPHASGSRGSPAHHRFDPKTVLLDPYARAVSGRDVWGKTPDWSDPFPHRGRIVQDDFDWEGDRPLEIPFADLVIYEMHVRGFTRHASSGVRTGGTFAALREKIPYLKELGVNCVELMPIFEFDEFEHSRPRSDGNGMLLNYWGYSTVAFFAPKAGFAATGRSGDGTMVADELKTTIRELHKAGIEVILDVVYNHTAEGNEHGPTISFKGIDNATYYMLTPDGYYYNFSGTGNTLNCNNPIVRNMVLDSLRYWASEYHIDGFRFDLAAILGRDPWGAPMGNPPLLEVLAFDPILGKVKLIAEAWDAGGLYQVGSFPSYGRWAEWNGRYRDTLRKLLKSEPVMGSTAQAVQAWPTMYGGRGPTASINFITCHDGFTLWDLVSYNGKHNEANGWDNGDGSNDNESWNCGVEGPTNDAGVLALRRQQVKNALAILFASQGVPMLLMGDEAGRTQGGNNNTYCIDDEQNWMDWQLVRDNTELVRFCRACIRFRHAHPVLRRREHLRGADYMGVGRADVSFHGNQAYRPDWNGRTLAFMLCGAHSEAPDDDIYVAVNSYWDALPFELPAPRDGRSWHVFANTSMASPQDCCEPGHEPRLENQQSLLVGGRSVVILVGR